MTTSTRPFIKIPSYIVYYLFFLCIDMDHPKKIRSFLFGQNLADGIRVTITIISPALIGSLTGFFGEGMAMALGALCLSICDAPGPVKHKRNGMFYGLLCVTVMAIATGFLNHYLLGMGLLITISTFFFSMFSIYGNRAASVGTASLLIMILRMSDVVPPDKVLSEAGMIVLGGIWYIIAALVFYTIRPYRPVQRALGDCITETARYLQIKSQLYDLTMDPAKSYNELINQQAVVNDKQNEVRDLLFRNRAILKESTFEGRLLVVTFVATVDLFEQIMATWYDYDELRKKYSHLDVLARISQLIKSLSHEMMTVGEAIHSQLDYNPALDLVTQLDKIKSETENILAGPMDITLRKIIINLRNLGDRIKNITRYFTARKGVLKTNLDKNDYAKFVPHQKINGSVFVNNLSMQSSAFRHSLRVMITCTAGFVLAKTFFTGNHSYWILMTIIIIMKPAYSLTKEKNIDRLIGTVAGGIIGLLLLLFIKNDLVLFGLLAFFMLGTYTFVRINYVVMVIFLTPYVLILFHFLGRNIVNIAGERLMDTAIASVLAWLAMHFLFPSWESHTIRNAMMNVLKANIRYLDKMREIIATKNILLVDYKLARKEVFVSTANLSAALHRMQSEPKSKQKYKTELYELVVLNHVLSSNVASITDSLMSEPRHLPGYFLHKLTNSMNNLEDTIRSTDQDFAFKAFATQDYPKIRDDESHKSLREQFDFIERITIEIKRISNKIGGIADQQEAKKPLEVSG